MRAVQNSYMQFGQVDISKIKFDPKSRDDMPQILRGLQHLYVDPKIRAEIFELLEKNILPKVDKKNGRPGMELWKILVLGVLRLDLNWDYDCLQDSANNHNKIRQMLGHPDLSDEHYYELQTLKDNVSLLTPELLDQINQVVVRAGHLLLKKKENEVLRGRCDSFVVETDVHYPTDINLLLDALRKSITLTARLCERYDASAWRQSAYNLRHVKRLMRHAQNTKRSKSKAQAQKIKREALVIKAHRDYIVAAWGYVQKIENTLLALEKQGFQSMMDILLAEQIKGFLVHAKRQISQIERRVILGEIIPSHEKVFSIFEPHTEWVVKGKAGVPVELGLKVCVLEDQYQFILHHRVMEKQTDEQVAILMVEEARERFPLLAVTSFDKGFHSPHNQQVLSAQLDLLALPRKGRLSQEALLAESSPEFRYARRKHSAIESAINALEVHGLDRCPDNGIDGFKRYVALAIVARNIQRIGAILQMQAQKQEMRRRRNRCAPLKLAA